LFGARLYRKPELAGTIKECLRDLLSARQTFGTRRCKGSRDTASFGEFRYGSTLLAESEQAGVDQYLLLPLSEV